MSREDLYDLIDGMRDSEKLSIFREYCDAYGSYDDMIYDNDEVDINEVFAEYDPYAILTNAYFGSYNPNVNYFCFDGYGNIKCFNKIDGADSPFYLDEIVDFIIDNDNDLGNSDIRDLLDSIDEDFDESLKRRTTRRKIKSERLTRKRRNKR